MPNHCWAAIKPIHLGMTIPERNHSIAIKSKLGNLIPLAQTLTNINAKIIRTMYFLYFL